MKHQEDNGFRVSAQDTDNLNIFKKKAGVPSELKACHTAFVEGYAIEGHVPAADIKRMLNQKPEIRGLAVPGMPTGSPGMEYEGQKDAYQTMSYTRERDISVFASH